MEKWDILDENGMPTGRTVPRGRCMLKSGEYHLVVHIWILSSTGGYLIQRRSDHKKLMPGEWAATGGAAIAGEDSLCAAMRELSEELGISCQPDDMQKLFRLKRRSSLLDVWTIVCDLPADRLTLQRSEVAEAKWVSEAALKEMIQTGRYHNYGKEYFDRVFEALRSKQPVLS